jgi:hypothetical protein
MDITRRSALKGLGTAGIAGGLGLVSLSGSAAAMSSTFTARDVSISNEDGKVNEIYVVPQVHTAWRHFDEEPWKIRYILEAGRENIGYFPVYRETPWLYDSSGPLYGTTDRYPNTGRAPLLTANSDFYSLDSDGNPTSTPKIVLYKDGMDAYHRFARDYDDPDGDGDNTNDGGTGQQHIDGSSLGDDAGAYANGNYGVIRDTRAFNAVWDGEVFDEEQVMLRLTTVLLTEDSDTVMSRDYGSYKDGGYTYEWLRDNAESHPAISVVEARFNVTVTNEPGDSGTSGVANSGIS